MIIIIQFQQIYSISSIEEHVIRCKCVICLFKRVIPKSIFPEMFARKLTTMLVTCYLLPNWFSTFINFFMEVFGCTFQCIYWEKMYVLIFYLNITVESIDRICWGRSFRDLENRRIQIYVGQMLNMIELKF